MKVVVVEDEQRISQFLKKGLTEKGYAVDVAADSDAGLERIMASAPDLVILDLLLPGSRDGIELCRELRARGVRAKIIMLTARDTVENKIEGLDAGADDYLVKPFRSASCSRACAPCCAARRSSSPAPSRSKTSPTTPSRARSSAAARPCA